MKPLLEAGISYEDIPLYETVFVRNEILAERVREMLLKGALDFAVFTSASTVRGFIAAIGSGREEIEHMERFCAVCIGKKTAEEAEKHGMRVRMPAQAEIDGMVELIRLYGKEEQGI